MANLLGANIGTNYKGFLNIDSTINTPLDTTLRAVTDGMGNVSPLQLSTDQVGLIKTVALSAGATSPRLFNEVYTINNSGAQTGIATGIFLNATETALNGMGHNLMDLQVNGVSKFLVNRFGTTTFGGNIFVLGGTSSQILAFGLGSNYQVQFSAATDGILKLSDGNSSSFNRIQLGGTTSSFPAIKRNGAAIDFRLADDSGYCGITGANFVSSGGYFYAQTQGGRFGNIGISYGPFGLNAKEIAVSGDNLSICATTGTGVSIGVLTLVASAILQADSTTKGFLPPRMTTTQKNAIASPATGLVVFDTTLNKLAVFTTVWETVTSV